MASKDIQALICKVDEDGANVGFLTAAQIDVIGANAKAIDKDPAVIAAKRQVTAAQIAAYYAKGSDTATDANRTMNTVLRKFVTRLGYKWNNKDQKFEDEGDAVFSSLLSCGTDSGKHTKAVRHTGGKEVPEMLRTTPEIAGWLGDVCRKYISVQKGAQKEKKTIEERILNYYLGCIDFDDTDEIAIKKAAKKFGLPEDRVKEITTTK